MLIVYFIISAFLIGLDQWTKYLTVTHLSLGEEQVVMPGIFSFTYVQNTGAAWSILEGQMWFFYGITFISVTLVIYLLIKHVRGNRWFVYGLVLILAGALGNFIDRVRLGYVVDMFMTTFVRFPIFNVADALMVIGVICIFIYMILEEKKEKYRDSTN